MKKNLVLVLVLCLVAFVSVSCSEEPEKAPEPQVLEVGGDIFYVYAGADDATFSLDSRGLITFSTGAVYQLYGEDGNALKTLAGSDKKSTNLNVEINGTDSMGISKAVSYAVIKSDDIDHFFVKNEEKMYRTYDGLDEEKRNPSWSAETSAKQFPAYNVQDEEATTANEPYTTSTDIGTGKSNTELLCGLEDYMKKPREDDEVKNIYDITVWQIVADVNSKDSFGDWYVPSRDELAELITYDYDAMRLTLAAKHASDYTGDVFCWSSSALKESTAAASYRYTAYSIKVAVNAKENKWHGSQRNQCGKEMHVALIRSF